MKIKFLKYSLLVYFLSGLAQVPYILNSPEPWGHWFVIILNILFAIQTIRWDITIKRLRRLLDVTTFRA